MRIAISSSGRTLDSHVDPRFGRAEHFIIVESENMNFEVLDNENAASAGGSGIGTAKLIADAGAKAVLTGNCGPNAQRTLSAASIKLFTGVSGIVSEVVESFKKGEITEASGANISSHFGMGKANG